MYLSANPDWFVRLFCTRRCWAITVSVGSPRYSPSLSRVASQMLRIAASSIKKANCVGSQTSTLCVRIGAAGAWTYSGWLCWGSPSQKMWLGKLSETLKIQTLCERIHQSVLVCRRKMGTALWRRQSCFGAVLCVKASLWRSSFLLHSQPFSQHCILPLLFLSVCY